MSECVKHDHSLPGIESQGHGPRSHSWADFSLRLKTLFLLCNVSCLCIRNETIHKQVTEIYSEIKT